MSFVALLSALTLGVSLFAVNQVRLRLRQQLIDIPNHRSSHKQPTPRGGGLGFVAAAIVGLAAYYLGFSPRDAVSPTHAPIAVGLWLSLLPLVVISLLDDWKTLRARTRYIVQFGVAISIVAQTGPFPQPWLQAWGAVGSAIAFALTVIGLTAFINFYNFMDGLDGLVAGVSIVQLGFCAVIFSQPVLWIVAAAVLGFLWWNWAPAKIFMGDAGSTALGATIAMVLLHGANRQLVASVDFAWAALTIALPLIADAIYTLIQRVWRRENIFQAHRTHLYQRLNQYGWPHAQVAIAYIASAVAIGLALVSLGSVGALLSVVAVIVVVWRLECYLPLVQSTPINIAVPYRTQTAKVLSDRQQG